MLLSIARKTSKRLTLATALCVLYLSPLSVNAADEEVRHITPPRLETAHLGKKILCHRPMRRGLPEMSVEVKGNQVIAHNYGHGGSGWTLGPGSAAYVDDLLVKSPAAADLRKRSPITVVGAGALGLFTAYDLYQRGYRNITVISDKFDDLTSHNAGGLLAPVSMDNDSKMQKVITKIGIDAYKFYDSIAKKTNPDFKDGAVVVPTYFENREDSGLEPYVGQVMQPAKDVILDFGNGTTRKMVSYDDGIFIDTAKMMTGLSKYLKAHNVKFKQEKVKKLSDLKGKYIINCTGLGAEKLNQDSKMVSVQGHLIMLKDQKPADLQHMILVYFKEGKTKSGQKVKRSFYVFPKRLANTGAKDIGVIGGTFIEGATPDTPNTEEFDIMLQNAKDFYGLTSSTP
jgi:FAD dependent oxidoreductase